MLHHQTRKPKPTKKGCCELSAKKISLRLLCNWRRGLGLLLRGFIPLLLVILSLCLNLSCPVIHLLGTHNANDECDTASVAFAF